MGNNFNISGVWQSLSDLWLPIALAIVGIIILILLIRFIIKKKWAGVVTTVIIAALVVGGGITYRLPHALSNIQADEISKIEVSDVEVTDPALIQDILDELNSSEYKRALPSGIGGREQYSVEIYDKNGEVELSLGIADESMVNTGTFWEQRENGKLDLSLFQAITEEAPAE
jgi:hypothetical protein